MDKDQYIKIADRLYKITLLFPKKEPLRYKMREVAVNILAGAGDGDFEILDRFFELAKAQNWVSLSEILAIQSEYANLRGVLREVKTKEIKEVPADFSSPKIDQVLAPKAEERSERYSRQEKIINFLKENSKAQVWQVQKIFPKVSKRTLRRDFEFLLKQGSIRRLGEKNSTFYQIRTV